MRRKRYTLEEVRADAIRELDPILVDLDRELRALRRRETRAREKTIREAIVKAWSYGYRYGRGV